MENFSEREKSRDDEFNQNETTRRKHDTTKPSRDINNIHTEVLENDKDRETKGFLQRDTKGNSWWMKVELSGGCCSHHTSNQNGGWCDVTETYRKVFQCIKAPQKPFLLKHERGKGSSHRWYGSFSWTHPAEPLRVLEYLESRSR